MTPRVTIEANRGRALTEHIADLDKVGAAAERGQITGAEWHELRQAVWDLAGSTRPPATDTDALATHTHSLLVRAEKPWAMQRFEADGRSWNPRWGPVVIAVGVAAVGACPGSLSLLRWSNRSSARAVRGADDDHFSRLPVAHLDENR